MEPSISILSAILSPLRQRALLRRNAASLWSKGSTSWLRVAGSSPRLWSAGNRAGEALLSPSEQQRSECAVESVSEVGHHVDLQFSDGSVYRFHAMWLRDACRDANHVSAKAGERILSATPAAGRCPRTVAASLTEVRGDGSLRIVWDDDVSCDSTFTGTFLRTYADIVAKPLVPAKMPPANVNQDWLKPYCGYPWVRAPALDAMNLWTVRSGVDQFKRFSCRAVEDTAVNLELMQALLRDGLVVVEHMPDAMDASELIRFTDNHVGSLQKDPAREEANWMITQKESAHSISYNPSLRLNNHTDQSIPSHGAVGLLLAVHYVEGHGFNTVVDGIAAGEAFRQKDPEGFRLLTTYHVDAERDYIASRIDASQPHTNSLLISTKYPILQTDARGALFRVQYNEVFRTPSMLPYDVFSQWYSAFRNFVDMLHSEEFERTIEMKKGELLLIQNWRVLHGRAGFQSPCRKLVGGTITRENFYSKACQLVQRQHGVEPYRLHVQHASRHAMKDL